jgi:hypothetical protein
VIRPTARSLLHPNQHGPTVPRIVAQESTPPAVAMSVARRRQRATRRRTIQQNPPHRLRASRSRASRSRASRSRASRIRVSPNLVNLSRVNLSRVNRSRVNLSRVSRIRIRHTRVSRIRPAVFGSAPSDQPQRPDIPDQRIVQRIPVSSIAQQYRLSSIWYATLHGHADSTRVVTVLSIVSWCSCQ